jgi:hypothetical protein
MEEGKYQKRYLAHQAKKKEILIQILEERNSTRMFSDKSVNSVEVSNIVEKCLKESPSSCDRKPQYVSFIDNRDDKALLGGLLVGGVGWVHRAPLVLLVFMDAEAYKGIGEINYMPYLDAGFFCCNILNLLEASGFKACFINPNIREENKHFFIGKYAINNTFSIEKAVFCGAIAVGYEK